MTPYNLRNRVTQAAVIVILFAILSGCASPTNPDDMTVYLPQNERYESITVPVSVVVGGGTETTNMSTSQISDAALKSAIESSLKETGLFSQVIETASDNSYVLSATVIDVEQPMMGFSMTVTLEIAWSLSRFDAKSPLWRASHESTYTAPASAAFAGVTRLKMATEGAVKENISWALETISKLDGL